MPKEGFKMRLQVVVVSLISAFALSGPAHAQSHPSDAGRNNPSVGAPPPGLARQNNPSVGAPPPGLVVAQVPELGGATAGLALLLLGGLVALRRESRKAS
jgi:hypothetical protein